MTTRPPVRMRRPRSPVWLLLVSLLLVAVAARAHEVRPAYLEITEVAQDRFDVLWKQPASGSLALRLTPRLSNGLLERPPSEQSSSNSFVVRRWQGLTMARDRFDGARLDIDGLQYTITDALVRVSFLSGQEIETILRPADPRLDIRLTGTGKLAVPGYLTLGVEHILTGFDHLSFVLGLLLLIRGRMTLLKTITAFTVAHSLTLGAAALGYVQVSVPVIEALVALSIVFVAVELARSVDGVRGLTARYPWLIAFTFGLLHGFAFAGSLAEIGLPPHNIPGALVMFNVGVELGQLAFVGVALLAIGALRSAPWHWPRWAPQAAPYAIGTLATFWMLDRIHVLGA